MREKDRYGIETAGLGKSNRGADAFRSLTLRVPKDSIFGSLGPNRACPFLCSRLSGASSSWWWLSGTLDARNSETAPDTRA